MPPDTHYADLQYGPHPRNLLDLWLAESERATPLVLYVHGGGFRRGDKSSLSPDKLAAYLAAGVSVAAINYRFTVEHQAPAPAAYLDCARALQFLRHHAEQWQLDPERVASTGGSAGAGCSLYLAYHPDLADPASDDEIARQSTRLSCVATDNGQCSYDPRFTERIGLPRDRFEGHDFFLPFYGITADETDTPRAHALYEAAAPITYLTADAPPTWMGYGYPDEEVDDDTPINLLMHHPRFGIALKERLDELGIECVVQYLDERDGKTVPHVDGARVESQVEFVCRHLGTRKP